MASSRQYDVILLGATGYTGKLTAEYITTNLPTNIKWAVSGRNQSKLTKLVDGLKALNSTRNTPDIVTISGLTASELKPVVSKTRVILNCIGPYHLYSTPVVGACAEAGTHYIDVTGETIWIREVIDKYAATAKNSGAVIIPGAGVESAPSDIIAWAATGLVRRVWDCGVMDMVASIHELRAAGASGGTLATGLSLLDHYSGKQVKDSLSNPFILSESKFRPEPTTYEKTGMQNATGVWSFPMLGTLTTSIAGNTNAAVVHRSASLTPLYYGFNFTYEEYMRASNGVIGALIHFALIIFSFLLSIAPFRMIAKAMAPKVGTGPSKEKFKNDVFEIRGVAIAEQLGKPRRAFASFRYEGNIYALTAILLAEAAMAILEKEEDIIRRHGVGFLTPSCLGEPYVEKIQKAGVKLSVKQIGDIGSK